MLFQSSVKLQLLRGAGEEVGTFLLFNPIQSHSFLGRDFLAQHERSLMTLAQVCYYLIAFPEGFHLIIWILLSLLKPDRSTLPKSESIFY